MLILECPENVCICVSVHMSFLSVPGGTLQCTAKNILQMHPRAHVLFQVCVHSWFAPNMCIFKDALFFLIHFTKFSLFFQLDWVIIDKIANIFKVYNVMIQYRYTL